MILPSSKLLSSVLGREVKKGTGRSVINDGVLTFAYVNDDIWSDINVDTLTRLTKEWLKNIW